MNLLLLPLVTALLAFLAGLLPALRFGPPPLLLVAASLLFLLAAAQLSRSSAIRSRLGASPETAKLAALRHTGFLRGPQALTLCLNWVPERSEPFVRGALLLALAGVGGALGAGAHRAAAADCRALLADETPLTVRGTLAANSVAGAQVPGGSAPLLPLQVREVRTAAGPVRGCTGAMRVRFPEEAASVGAGAELQLTGQWRRFRRLEAPGGWPRDPRFAGFLLIDEATVVAPPSLTTHPLLTLRGRSEAHLQRLFPRHGAIAEALLLGRRELLDPALRERFARAGLAHLLAISGMHVGLIAGVFLLVGKVLRLPRRRLAWLTILAVALYLAMIGAPPSAVRAGTMISLALTGMLLQRPFAALPVVAAAALAILAHRPTTVLEPGFQLSFAGVLGILLLRPLVLDRLPHGWRHEGWKRWPIETLTVSAAAFAATAPVAAWHFGLIAPIAVLANLPAIPLMSLGLIGIGAAALIEPLLPPVGRLLADGAGGVLDLLGVVATLAGQVPYGHLEVARPQGWMWGAGALAFFLALDAARRLRGVVRWTVATGSTAAVLLAWPSFASPGGAALELYFLDVGQGDATAVRTPQNRWLLVDAGPRSDRFDAGERLILPFLRAQGVRRLEAIILTHPHADHIGGAPALLERLEVGRLIEPGHVAGSALYLQTLRTAEARGVEWVAARSGRTLRIDGITIELLWPDEEALDGVTDANEISAVTLLRYGNLAVLLTGDAYMNTEHQLIERHGEALRAQILKAGHHGSRTSTSEALLEVVRPELVVISAGRKNRFGHPAPEVLDRLRERGIEVARTDLEGTIAIRAASPQEGRWRRLAP